MPLADYLDIGDLRLRRLASRAGMSFDRLRAVAGGEQATASELKRLSNVLGVGVTDLLRPALQPQDAAYRFRSAALASAHGEAVGRKTISEIGSRIDAIHEIAGVVDWAQGAWVAPANVAGSPFALAAWFRESCYGGDQLSPILELATILDNCLNIVTVVLRRSLVDGVSAVVGNIPFIFIRAQFKPRMLFTLAHELGHLLAHAGNGDFASIDPVRSTGRAVSDRAEERFANEFASELLMPAQGVGVALTQVRNVLEIRDTAIGDIEIIYLAHLFGVSFEVAARRCEALRLLPRGGASSLIEFISLEFGSAEKRAAEAGLPPRPDSIFPNVSDRVLRAAAQAVENGELSIGRVLDRLQVSYADLMTQHEEARIEHHH